MVSYRALLEKQNGTDDLLAGDDEDINVSSICKKKCRNVVRFHICELVCVLFIIYCLLLLLLLLLLYNYYYYYYYYMAVFLADVMRSVIG